MRFEMFDDAASSALTEPVIPLIEGLLDEGAFSVVYGDSGSGKTFVALDLAFRVACGTAST
jgi:RecA-family ATPase